MDAARAARRSNRIANRRPRAVRAWSRVHAGLFRATRGRFVPRWFGAPVLVLETVGRRSGKPRSTPLIYLRDGERLVVLAANAGAHRVPDWWLNLRAAAEATVVEGGSRRRVRPRLILGEERERLWPGFVAIFPQAAEYPQLTDRPLPLIALDPA